MGDGHTDRQTDIRTCRAASLQPKKLDLQSTGSSSDLTYTNYVPMMLHNEHIKGLDFACRLRGTFLCLTFILSQMLIIYLETSDTLPQVLDYSSFKT